MPLPATIQGSKAESLTQERLMNREAWLQTKMATHHLSRACTRKPEIPNFEARADAPPNPGTSACDPQRPRSLEPVLNTRLSSDGDIGQDRQCNGVSS